MGSKRIPNTQIITMSHFRNPESLNSAQGEFSSHVKPSEPLTTKGHAPGVKVGNDAAPEFSAETYPPGTAPSDRTFKPNPVDETSTENSAVPKASDTRRSHLCRSAPRTRTPWLGADQPGVAWHSQEGTLRPDWCWCQLDRPPAPAAPRPTI